MEYLKNINMNTLYNSLQKHLIPMAAGITAGSLFTWSDPRGLAIALITQKALSTASSAAVGSLSKQFPHISLNVKSKLALVVLSLSARIFTGHYVALLAGLPTSYLAIIFANLMKIETCDVQDAIYREAVLAAGSAWINRIYANNALPHSKNVIEVTSENFQKEIEESDLPVIVDAYATWCPACRFVAPIFTKLSDEHQGKVKFAKFNVDSDWALTKKLDIERFPTFVFYKDGKRVETHPGSMNYDRFMEKIGQLFTDTTETAIYAAVAN